MHSRELKRLLIALAAALVVGCDEKPTRDDSANELIDLGHQPFTDEKTWTNVGSLVCRPETLRICSKVGCEERKGSNTFIRWTPKAGTLERCGGATPCNTYQTQVSYSGVWTNIAVPDHGMLARVTAGGDYLEVLTQMSRVFVYHGHCERVR